MKIYTKLVFIHSGSTCGDLVSRPALSLRMKVEKGMGARELDRD